MKKLFIDSDIILDLLIERDDYISAAQLLSRIYNGEFEGYTSPLVVANVYYIITKYEGKNKALESIKRIRQILSIIPIDEQIIDEAIIRDSKDFEDAIQFIAAEKNSLSCIITRNKKDYIGCKIPVQTAKEFINIK